MQNSSRPAQVGGKSPKPFIVAFENQHEDLNNLLKRLDPEIDVSTVLKKVFMQSTITIETPNEGSINLNLFEDTDGKCKVSS